MLHLTLVLLTGPLAPPAYLDPGSGSFIFQMLVAAALGIVVAISASWSKIKKRLGIKPKVDETDEDAADEKDDGDTK
jgi:hypothetical protein